MDVTCDRCGTDYEFEETLVSTRGTTVKCTQCGHLFKVYRAEIPVEPSAERHTWTVKRADGSIHRLASLADLTRLIREGTFAREDEVSRTGKAWKKLGEIEELKTFFASSERPATRQRRSTVPDLGIRTSLGPPATPAAALAGATGAPSAAPPVPSGAGVAGTTATSNAPSGVSLPRGVSTAPQPPAATAPPSAAGGSEAAPAPRKRNNTPAQPMRFESLGKSVELDSQRAPAVPERTTLSGSRAPSPRDREPAGPTTRDSMPQKPRESADAEDPADVARTSRRRAVSIEANLPPELELPKAIDYPEVKRAGVSSWLWALLVLVIGAVAGAVLLWPALEQRLAPPPARDPTAEFVARADAALSTHRIQHFADAATEYVKALAFHENDPHILSSLSRVYAVWSQELRFKAKALSILPDEKNVEHRSELVSLNREQREQAEQAKRYGETAARKNPGNEEAEVALADALRLTGNLVGARGELDRARATESAPSAETLRVAALLAIDESSGDMRAGVKLASQAVAQEPDLIRTRLLLARCLVADGDEAAARYHLNAVTMRDRSHPGVIAVEQEIDQKKLQLTAAGTAASGGVAAGADGRADAGASSATAQDGTQPKPDTAADAPIDNLSPEGYVARGQALLELGQVTAAQRMFEQALFVKPSSGPAHTGLGYVALEKGRPQLAVEHFLPAAKAGSSEALIGLGDAYRRLSRPRDALKAYQSYLTRSPSGPQANIARAQVDRLTEELGPSGN